MSRQCLTFCLALGFKSLTTLGPTPFLKRGFYLRCEEGRTCCYLRAVFEQNCAHVGHVPFFATCNATPNTKRAQVTTESQRCRFRRKLPQRKKMQLKNDKRLIPGWRRCKVIIRGTFSVPWGGMTWSNLMFLFPLERQIKASAILTSQYR